VKAVNQQLAPPWWNGGPENRANTLRARSTAGGKFSYDRPRESARCRRRSRHMSCSASATPAANRCVRYRGSASRSSSRIGYGSAVHSGSRCEKSSASRATEAGDDRAARGLKQPLLAAGVEDPPRNARRVSSHASLDQLGSAFGQFSGRAWPAAPPGRDDPPPSTCPYPSSSARTANGCQVVSTGRGPGTAPGRSVPSPQPPSGDPCGLCVRARII